MSVKPASRAFRQSAGDVLAAVGEVGKVRGGIHPDEPRFPGDGFRVGFRFRIGPLPFRVSGSEPHETAPSVSVSAARAVAARLTCRFMV